MEEFYLLDENLKRTYIIDIFSSAIWNKGYNTVGDFELVIPASKSNFQKVNECKYVIRSDDDMVGKIEKIELQTDEESGDSIIISGVDIKEILNQRIVMNQTNFNGYVEDYIRTLINDSIINPSDEDRKIENFILGEKIGFTEKIKEQVTYDYVGEKIQELCQSYGWGYKITVENEKFVFSLYEGEDKSKYITFSQNYDNISTTDYSKDDSNIKNVTLIAGQGQGVNRVIAIIGEGVGIDRHELYVDARDVSNSIDYSELLSSYPNGEEVIEDDVVYYQVDGANIAILTKDESDEVTEAQLCDDIYSESLKSTGYEKMASYGSVTSFSGEVILGINYTYKEDFDLGDIVRIVNEYGISMNVRITEILENKDSTGYKIEPTFENIE